MPFRDVPLRIRRALALHKVYGYSALLVVNRTCLNSVNALWLSGDDMDPSMKTATDCPPPPQKKKKKKKKIQSDFQHPYKLNFFEST